MAGISRRVARATRLKNGVSFGNDTNTCFKLQYVLG